MTGVALAFRGGFAPPVFIGRVCQAAGTPMIVPATDSAGDAVCKSAMSSPGFPRGSFSWFPKQPRTLPLTG